MSSSQLTNLTMLRKFLSASIMTLLLALSMPLQALAGGSGFTVDTQTSGGDITSMSAGQAQQILQISVTQSPEQQAFAPQYALIEEISLTMASFGEVAPITNFTLKDSSGQVVSTTSINAESDIYNITVNRAVDLHQTNKYFLYATSSNDAPVGSSWLPELNYVKIRTADNVNYSPFITNHDYTNYVIAPPQGTSYTVKPYQDALDDNFTQESFFDGGDVPVQTVRINPSEDSKLKSVTIEVKGNLSAYTANLKAGIGYPMNKQVSSYSNGKYKITFDNAPLAKNTANLLDIYLDPSQSPLPGQIVQGYTKVTAIELIPADAMDSVSVTGLPLESQTLSLKGPYASTSNNSTISYVVEVYRDSTDNSFTQETFYDGGDVPVHTVRFSFYQGAKLKSLTAKVTGDLAKYVANLKALQNGKPYEQMKVAQLSNGEYKFTFNSSFATNGVNFVDIYLDPSKSPASGTSVNGYVTVTGVELVADDIDKTITVNGLPVSSDKLTLKSGATANVIPAREYEEPLPNSENPFSDIGSSQLSSLEARAAIALEAKGIIGGYLVSSNGPIVEFRGYNNVNRAEAAKFLVNSLGLAPSEFCNYSVAPDVAEGEWYTKYVCTAQKYGIMTGHDDGFFRPGDWVTSEQFAKMIFKAHSLSDYPGYTAQSGEIWYRRYGMSAQYHNLFPNQTGGFEPGHNLSRFEVAIAIYTVL